MLQFQVIDDFGNPDLPISNSRSTLYLDSALRIYEMLDSRDKSDNGKNLVLSGLSFDSTGLICDGLAGHYADTGLVEPSEYTIVTAFRADVPTATQQIYSSLAEGVSPYRGSRAAITVDGAVVVDVGIDGATTARALTGVVAPSWEMFAISLSNNTLTLTRGSNMGVLSVPVNSRRQPINSFRLGGGYLAPHNLGIVGRIGFWAAYSGVLDSSVITSLMTKGRTLMNQRGVTLP